MSDDLKAVDRLRKRLHGLGYGGLAEGISRPSHGEWPSSKSLVPVVDALADEIEWLQAELADANDNRREWHAGPDQ
ncbi:MAG: hypothetical protein GY701_11370 [Sulfitobacter sp.]|nr:hypothetical protein [Sulfitobacter sp.]